MNTTVHEPRVPKTRTSQEGCAAGWATHYSRGLFRVILYALFGVCLISVTAFSSTPKPSPASSHSSEGNTIATNAHRAGDVLHNDKHTPPPASEGHESERPHEEGLDIAHEIFHELTDSTEHPFFTIATIRIGSFSFDIAITKHTILLFIVVLLVFLSMRYLAKRLETPFETPTRMQGMFEMIVEYMKDEVIGPALGEDGKGYLPFCLTVFLFVLYANLLGLIPPFAMIPVGEAHVWLGGAITGNIAITGGLSLITLLVLKVAGIKKKGFLRYWAGLVPHGVPLPLFPLVWIIEFVGVLTKIVALTMRLFANMTGGHIALLAVLLLPILIAQTGSYIAANGFGVAAVIIGMIIFTLEIAVSFLQAYIFSFLTAIFIAIAMEEH